MLRMMPIMLALDFDKDGELSANGQKLLPWINSAGATVGSRTALRGPTRRSSNGAKDRCQLAAAISRSAALIVTCPSRSASPRGGWA